MPGASWMGPGKPIGERSAVELVITFVVLPVPFGGFILAAVVRNALANAATFTPGDWLFQVVITGLLGMGVAVGLPVVAFQEFRRRRARKGTQAGPGASAGRPNG